MTTLRPTCYKTQYLNSAPTRRVQYNMLHACSSDSKIKERHHLCLEVQSVGKPICAALAYSKAVSETLGAKQKYYTEDNRGRAYLVSPYLCWLH